MRLMSGCDKAAFHPGWTDPSIDRIEYGCIGRVRAGTHPGGKERDDCCKRRLSLRGGVEQSFGNHCTVRSADTGYQGIRNARVYVLVGAQLVVVIMVCT